MKTSNDILAPLLGASEVQLAEFLVACATGEQVFPHIDAPPDYDTTADFLLDCLREVNDSGAFITFGDAAVTALMRLVDEGRCSLLRSKPVIRKALVDILNLIEALPCRYDLAEQLGQYLLLLLATRSYTILSDEESDLRARMLLALSSKIESIQTIRPELARWLEDDFSDPRYVVPAFSVAFRLNQSYASHYLWTAVACLRRHELPTRYLLFDVAKVIVNKPAIAESVFSLVQSSGDGLITSEFSEALRRLAPPHLVQMWNRFSPDVIAIAEELTSREIVQSDKKVFPYFDTRFRKLDDFLCQRISHRGNDHIRIGEDLGDEMGLYFSREWSVLDDPQKAKGEVLDVVEIAKLVKHLDNGYWAGKTEFQNALPIPGWFIQDSMRREIAAQAVRQSVQQLVVKKVWITDQDSIVKRIKRTSLPGCLSRVVKALPGAFSERKVLRLGVSPFPEDQLLFFVLKSVGETTDFMTFDSSFIRWGETNAALYDCSLVNEFCSDPLWSETSSEHDVVVHKGYFAWGTQAPPPDSESRLRLLLQQGFRRYNIGEYPRWATQIENKLALKRDAIGSPMAAPSWDTDFTDFITGRSRFYVGGSINARLLKRLWEPTGRVFPICEPHDFKSVRNHYPVNRIVLGHTLSQTALGPPNMAAELRQALAGLYREAGKFLSDVAREAEANPRSEGRCFIRHFMNQLAAGSDVHPNGAWNFVVAEQDMIDLILKDNEFLSPVT